MWREKWMERRVLRMTMRMNQKQVYEKENSRVETYLEKKRCISKDIVGEFKDQDDPVKDFSWKGSCKAGLTGSR